MINSIEQYIDKLEIVYKENIKTTINPVKKEEINEAIRFAFDNILGGNDKDILIAYVLFRSVFNAEKDEIYDICVMLHDGFKYEVELNQIIEQIKIDTNKNITKL